jgi:hypothetical protein
MLGVVPSEDNTGDVTVTAVTIPDELAGAHPSAVRI